MQINLLPPRPTASGRLPARNELSLMALLVSLAASWLTSSGAHAQQALEEIIVTAERREQNLQDVPIAASVFTAQDFDAKGIDRIHDIQMLAPSVAINTYNRSTFINIRGVGLALSAPAAVPGVAYYIDGVFVPKEQHIAHSFFDIDSMEVLRGPQGTLTGQNSTGGAIYARSPAPEFGAVSGYVDQTVASDDWYRTTAALNIPASDRLAFRIAGAYDSRGSFTKNIGPSDSKPGSGDFIGMRARMAWQATDDLLVNLGIDYFNNDTDYNALKHRDDAVTDDPFVIEEDARSYFDQEGFRASAEFTWDFNDQVRFRSISSYQFADSYDQADGDRTATALPVPAGLPASGANRAMYPGRVAQASNEFEYFITEANLLSIDDGPLQWVVGGFYMHEKIPLTLYRDNYNTTDFVSSSSDIETESKAESVAVFGQINYRFMEDWELIGGIRYSDDSFSLTRFILPGPPPPGGFPNTEKSSQDEFTGRVGLNFHADEDSMLYGTVTKGYKAGAVNLTPGYGPYAPEKNLVYEVGYKTTLLDNSLRINSALFYSDYDDFQLLTLLSIGGGPPLPTFQNGTKGEAFGAEVELLYARDRFSWNLGVGYLDAEFAGDVLLNNANTGGLELVPKGRAMPFSPRWTVNGGLQYDFDWNGWIVTPRFQVSYLGTQYATPYPSRFTRVPNRTVADLRLTLRPNDAWRLEAFATNLLDERYIAAQIQDASSADGGIIYGDPLQFGARVRFQF